LERDRILENEAPEERTRRRRLGAKDLKDRTGRKEQGRMNCDRLKGRGPDEG
jgi:hypothetical protein